MNGITYNRDIDVEQQDIDEAVPRDQYQCAIVLAIQRRYPEALRVTVNAKQIAFSIREDRFVYPTPAEAIEAIIKPLDTGGTPEPVTIKLRGGIVKDVQTSAPSSEETRRDQRLTKRQKVGRQKRDPRPHNRKSEWNRF